MQEQQYLAWLDKEECTHTMETQTENPEKKKSTVLLTSEINTADAAGHQKCNINKMRNILKRL